MRAFVVYESMFGNTRRIAEAIADGMSDGADVTTVAVSDAPAEVPDDVGIVVVGGPTHVFSMSRETTRQEAGQRGALSDTSTGIREWLHNLPSCARPTDFAAFDTRVDTMALLPGAASRAAARIGKKLGYHVLDPTSFLVEGYEGPLVDGEVERARDWGHALTETLAG